MKLVATAALFAAGTLLSGLSHAQIYMCKDASGKTITSDRPIPECADRPVREYGSTGALKREIPPPPTHEERRKQREEEERKKAEAAAAKEQKRVDDAILARYRSEADIETARKRALDNVEEQKKRESTSLANAEKQLKLAQVELDAHKKGQTKPPATLTHKFEEAQSSVNESKKRIQDQDAEIAKINATFDKTLQRFKELTGPVAPAK